MSTILPEHVRHSLLSSYYLLGSVCKAFKAHPEADTDYISMRADDVQCDLAEAIRHDWDNRVAQDRIQLCFKPLPTYGDLMPVADWLATVENGCFIDYDGEGRLATVNEESNISVKPSFVTSLKLPLPSWATHVMWYNR